MPNKYYIIKKALIRKEHFGTLILLGDGRRYIVDKSHFKLLKKIAHHFNILSDKKTRHLLNEFLAKGVLTSIKKESGRTRIIENEYINQDCLSYPRTVYWECTNKCNYFCRHCYSSSGEEGLLREIPFNIIKKFINELAKRGTEFLSIGGGEPLLYKNIYKVIKYATEHGLGVEITTNASLINNRIIKKLKQAGLKFIQVSLDGIWEKTYLKIRQGGDYKHVKGIIPVLAKNFVLSICTVVNKINYNEINEIINFSIKSGARHYRVLPLMETGRGSEIKKWQLSKIQLRSLHKFISARKKIEKAINIQFNENLISPVAKNIFWLPDNHYGCSAGRTTCSLDAAGNVYPCSFLETNEFNCGNIGEQQLSVIWKNSSVLKKIRELNKITGKCAKCKYLSVCRGGCRASAYLKNCRINDSDPFCSIF